MRLDLLDLFGIGYIVDCIYNAIAERVAEENYRAYETDCLMAICRTLGVKIPKRYYEILHPAPEENRSGSELAAERLERFGIKVVDE